MNRSGQQTDDRSPATQSVQIETGARLHFGLVDTSPPFGGCGVMIDGFGAVVKACSASSFAVEGLDSMRVTAIARRLSDAMDWTDLPRCQVQVIERPLAHSGLGSGTQLSLATAEAMCRCLQLNVPDDVLASQIAKRGLRSAVGIHGYFSGGLIVEGSSGDVLPTPINACRHHLELPSEWRVVVMLPRRTSEVICGDNEVQQFDQLRAGSTKVNHHLHQLLNEQLMPAARDGIFNVFADTVQQYNRLSGELFEAVQGGSYNGAVVQDLVDQAIERGGRGIGQSSWGPAVFAWFENEDSAESFVDRMANEPADFTITSVRNHGRS